MKPLSRAEQRRARVRTSEDETVGVARVTEARPCGRSALRRRASSPRARALVSAGRPLLGLAAVAAFDEPAPCWCCCSWSSCSPATPPRTTSAPQLQHHAFASSELLSLVAAAASHSFGLATETAEPVSPEEAALAAGVSHATRGGGLWHVPSPPPPPLPQLAIGECPSKSGFVDAARARQAALLCSGMASPPRCVQRRPRPPSRRSSDRDGPRCGPQRRVRHPDLESQ